MLLACSVSGADCHDVVDQHWINGYPTPIANPMSPYPRYQPFRKSWGINALGSVVVEVEGEDGTCGVGEGMGGEVLLRFPVTSLLTRQRLVVCTIIDSKGVGGVSPTPPFLQILELMNYNIDALH